MHFFWLLVALVVQQPSMLTFANPDSAMVQLVNGWDNRANARGMCMEGRKLIGHNGTLVTVTKLTTATIATTCLRNGSVGVVVFLQASLADSLILRHVGEQVLDDTPQWDVIFYIIGVLPNRHPIGIAVGRNDSP